MSGFSSSEMERGINFSQKEEIAVHSASFPVRHLTLLLLSHSIIITRPWIIHLRNDDKGHHSMAFIFFSGKEAGGLGWGWHGQPSLGPGQHRPRARPAVWSPWATAFPTPPCPRVYSPRPTGSFLPPGLALAVPTAWQNFVLINF